MLCADTDRAAFSGDGPDIVFLSQRAFFQIACENAAFIVRRKGELPREFSCKNAVAIIDSADPAVLSAVARAQAPRPSPAGSAPPTPSPSPPSRWTAR